MLGENEVVETLTETKLNFPVFSKYNPIQDYGDIVEFIQAHKFNPPDNQIIYAIVCRINGKIVGFACLLINHFVEPLIVDSTLPLTTKTKVTDSMLFMIGGVASYLNIDKLYFIPEKGGEKFLSFLQKQFKIKEFVEKTVYVVEL
jgi:hypothetical protein